MNNQAFDPWEALVEKDERIATLEEQNKMLMMAGKEAQELLTKMPLSKLDTFSPFTLACMAEVLEELNAVLEAVKIMEKEEL